jgi:hypothetical protein
VQDLLTTSACGTILLFLLASPGHCEEISGSSFRAGHWDGKAYTADDGSFSHCAAISSQPKSTLLVFSRAADGSSYIGILRAGWKLPVGKTYPVSVSLDAAPWGVLSAETLQEDLIRFGPLRKERLAALRYGSTLTVTAAQEAIALTLQDSRAVLDGLSRCTAKYTPSRATAQASAVPTNPFANASHEDSVEDIKGLVGPVLINAGITDTAWVDGATVGYKSAVLGWRAASVEGALFIKQGDLNTLRTQLRKTEAEACTGSFLASQPVTETAGNKSISSYEFVCGSGESMSAYAVVEVMDPKDQSNLIFVNDASGEKNATGLVATNEKLRRLLVYLNKPDT